MLSGMSDEKIRENRLRRMAARQGVQIVKSRRRDPRSIDYGGFMLVDSQTNTVLAGGSPIAYSLNMDDVEDYLTGPSVGASQ